MSILGNKVNDKQFPIEVVLNNKTQKFTEKAAIELIHKLQVAINVESTKCDGNHGGPKCSDTKCWNDDEKVKQSNHDALINNIIESTGGEI